MTVTGNKRELEATGKFVGGGVKYGATQALSITSDFTAKVPELVARNASVSAVTNGTFASGCPSELRTVAIKSRFREQSLHCRRLHDLRR